MASPSVVVLEPGRKGFGSLVVEDLLVVKRFLNSSTPHREVFTRLQIRSRRHTISTNVPGHHS
ncbi:hypothetical protein AERO9AM_10130 [Aeromicrobium sp. 9AM]|nr:hypothetical protein AERO9AM_10130 [Aeromicrobium sp. 9AM]